MLHSGSLRDDDTREYPSQAKGAVGNCRRLAN
jgi:hypothetical protein